MIIPKKVNKHVVLCMLVSFGHVIYMSRINPPALDNRANCFYWCLVCQLICSVDISRL